jgi:hypothetical protein
MCAKLEDAAHTRTPQPPFIVTGEHMLDRAYKVPSRRNVAERAPYMDAGQFATVAEVLHRYNRAPAAATALYRLSKRAVWWLRVGIHIERIAPGQPQQNGRHERMHLTLKKDATKPAAADVL